MGDNLELKVSNTQKIRLGQGSDFECIMGQFQSLTHMILCVTDGHILKYYTREGPFPDNIKYESKRKGEDYQPIEYHFKDDSGRRYCVYTRENALLFYPRLNEIDPEGRVEIIPRLFPRVNTQSTVKRPSIIEPVLTPNIIQPYIDNTGRLNETDRATITRQIITNTGTVQDKVTVIDNGLRYVFPNPNFPVEIKTYQPT